MMADASIVEPCRVIVDPIPGSGAWNMAVDEALLESAVAGAACATRWYRWSQPTLSTG
jgi:lipoate-protein ligase A